LIGTKLVNRYEILHEIGRGGMGAVYLAHDPLLRRDVAAKLIPRESLPAGTEGQFRGEAEMVAQLDHPGIVSVYDVGEHDGALFFIMPLLQGKNLRDFITACEIRIGDVVTIGIQLAEALDYSHQRGVIHRDVKPENIMVTLGEGSELRVRITDFGVATRVAGRHSSDRGEIVGTVSYISPEQILNKESDARSDIYSLGTVLYECLCGDTPFTGDIPGTLYRIVYEQPERLRHRNREVDPELDSIVMACLEKERARRPKRAKAVADALIRYRSKLRDSGRIAMPIFGGDAKTPRIPSRQAFVGREKELAQVEAALNRAMAGECQFVLVGGEEGVGKSRLLAEVEQLAATWALSVLQGRVLGLEVPYNAFGDAIHEWLKREERKTAPAVDLSDLSGDLMSLFPALNEQLESRGAAAERFSPPASEERSTDDRIYVYEVLARTLIRIAQGKPLVFLLEDLHAGDASVEALQYIVRRLGGTPTLFVATYRTTAMDRRHSLTRLLETFRGDRRFLHVILHSLPADEHRMLVESLVGSTVLENELVEKLYEGTEGNPYFTVELIRSLRDSGSIIPTRSGSWSFASDAEWSAKALPDTIQQTVEQRIQRLPEPQRELLSMTSVLGRTFTARELSMVADGEENLEDALDRMVASGLVEEARERNRFAFTSGVVREVLYSRLSRRRRRALHLRYAERLEARHAGQLERVYSQLVHHFAEGDDPDRVVEYGLRLIQTSLQASSAEDAIRAAKTTLACLPDSRVHRPSIEGDIRKLLAQAHRLNGNLHLSLDELELAIAIFESAANAPDAVQAILAAAETSWEARRVVEARRWVERGLPVARAIGASESLLRLLNLGATLASLRAEYGLAKLYLDESEQLAADHGAPDADLPNGGTLVVPLSTHVSAAHPAEIVFGDELEVLGCVFETLTTIDRHGNLIPMLCEQWEGRDDARSFRFLIRGGVQLHDGRQITARDVKRSIEHAILRSRRHLPEAFAPIVGAEEMVRGESSHVRGLIAESAESLLIKLTESIPIYPVLLTNMRAAIALPRTRDTADEEFVGTGPFRVAARGPSSVRLHRNPSYWRSAPSRLDAIEFRTSVSPSEMLSGLRDGSFDLARDLVPDDLEAILRDHSLRTTLIEALRRNTYFVVFKNADSLCEHHVLRDVLCSLVRPDDLVRRTLGRFASPAESLLPPGILGHDSSRRRQHLEPERAREMLRQAGLPLPLHLRGAAFPYILDRFSALIDDLFSLWREVGIEISVETLTLQQYEESLQDATGFDVLLTRWIADYDDPDTFFTGTFHSRFGDMRAFCSSAELDALIENARMERSPAHREKIYRRIEDLLIDTGRLLPLFHEIDYRIAGARVRGLALATSPPYVNYAQLGRVENEFCEGARRPGGHIVVPLSGDVTSLDPSLTATVIQTEVLPNVFETLTKPANGARIVPWLADRIEADDGGRRFHFRLRENVRFHNGHRLTSRDVRHSFERLLRSNESKSRWLLSPIRGAAALLAEETRELSGFTILSDREFVVELEEPVSFFPALLAYHCAAIVPEGQEEFSEQSSPGTGPFRVVRFEPGRRLELAANERYWKPGLPKCEGLTFDFRIHPSQIESGFRNGRYSLAWDLMPSNVETLRRDARMASHYQETPLLSTYVLIFNIHSGRFASEAARHELVRALDLDALVSRNLGRLGIRAHGLIPPGLLGFEASQPPPRRLTPMAHARGVEISAIVHRVYEETYATFTEDLFELLRSVGCTLAVSSTRPEKLKAFEQVSADICLNRWITDYPDTDGFLTSLLHTEKGYHGRLCGLTAIDDLLEQARREIEPSLRHRIYRQVEEIIAARALLIPLFHEQAYRFARREVEGFEVRLTDPLVPYEQLWMRS